LLVGKKESSEMGYFHSLPQDLWQAFLGAVAASVVAGLSAFVATRIPQVRTWFVRERLGVPLITAFLMSVVVAGSMGLFLRHLTWEEVQPLKRELASMNAGFSIVAGGRVDSTGTVVGGCDKPIKPGDFQVEREQEGQYRVCFGEQLPEDSIILTSPVLGRTDKATNVVSVHVVNSYRSSFEVMTSLDGNAADRAFGFLVLHRAASQ
jgi:hypothetical protein